MAIYHCQVKNIGRSSGRSAVACSAYRSASEMEDEELGKHFDYTKKHGVEYSNVFLCKNAPEEYADREILWNAVQKVETAKDARLSREFEVALPHDLTNEQQEKLAERFAKSLTDEGMCVQVDIHRIEGNHHAHMMATTRQIKENGEWDTKYKKVYANDRNEQGKPIFNPDKGQTPEDRIPQLNEDGTQKVRIRKGKGEEKLWERVNVQYNEWDKREKIGEWRERWANYTNEALEQAQSQERVTHLSFKAQGKEELPTIHEGYSTVKKEINEEIREYNNELHKLNYELEFYGKIRDITLDKLTVEREEQAHERVGESSKRVGTAIQETAGSEQKIAEYGRTLEERERERERESRQFTEMFGDTTLQTAGVGTDQQRIGEKLREAQQSTIGVSIEIDSLTRRSEYDYTKADNVGEEQRSINRQANNFRDKLNAVRERLITVRDTILQKLSRAEQAQQQPKESIMARLNRLQQVNQENREKQEQDKKQTEQSRTQAILERAKQANEQQRAESAQNGTEKAETDKRESIRDKLQRATEKAQAEREQPLEREQKQENSQEQQTFHRRRGTHR